MTSISNYVPMTCGPFPLPQIHRPNLFSRLQAQTTQCIATSPSGRLKYISNQSCPNNHTANHFHPTGSSSSVSIHNLMKLLFIQYTSLKLSNTFNIDLSLDPHTPFFSKAVNYDFLKYLLHFCTCICTIKTLVQNFQHLSPGLL